VTTSVTTDPTGLVDRLAATIQARVLSGEIATGSRLRQETLAAEFGVSRTPVREALRKLQSTGLVEVAPNRGAVVRAPTPTEVRDSYAVRAELEGFATQLAVTLISDDQLEQLRGAERHFRHAVDDVIHAQREGRAPSPWPSDNEWERANDVFHRVIQTAAGNRQLRASIGFLHRTFPRHLTWAALSTSSHLFAENVEEHHRILGAIERRDPAAARAEMAAHVRSAGELVARQLERLLG
jgi:DNA-binding GntR family transcriptional regulator